MRVAILAPIQNSLYSRIVTHLMAQTPGVQVVGVLVRSPWSWTRIRSELRRDGTRLLRKVYRKLILKEKDFDLQSPDHLLALAKECHLPGSTLSEVCAAHGIPCRTFSDHNAPSALQFLSSMNPDVVAFTGGGLIRKKLLEIPTLGTVNCHMGPLPRYRGMDVVEYPVLENRVHEEGIGLTLHFMDQGVDTGPILMQRRIDPKSGETFPKLRHRMERQMAELMVAGMAALQRGALSPQSQRVADGRQYYVMHARIHALAVDKLRRLVDAA